MQRVGRMQNLRKSSLVLVCVLVMSFSMSTGAEEHAAKRTDEARNSSDAALHFEANRGQTDGHVKYLARATAYNIFLAEDEADIVLHREAEPSGTIARGKMIIVQAYANVLRMRFANSNPPTTIVPLLYRKGSNPAAKECTAVAYRGVYAGTDIIFHGDQRKIGLDLSLSPGADPTGIVLTLDGATGIVLDAAGNAVVRVGEVSLVLQKPAIFEVRDGRRRPLAGAFRIEPHNRLRIVVGLPSANEQVITG
ncbi:MAG TPA: hypothetical protein VJN90_11755 [Candidatus Acidoferrales bacterium]|nr:hypothetical protein [Candidatus Acidoferrales bacterium]